MKVAGSIKSAGIAFGAICLQLIAFGVAQAAVVQGRASAEVVNAAQVDPALHLAGARVQAAGGTAGPAVNKNPQPARHEVSVVTVHGVTWLSIDYN